MTPFYPVTGTATHTGVTSPTPAGPSPPKSSSPKPPTPEPAPPPPPLLVTSRMLACTVGHETVLIDMVPPDGTCDIIFYTDVFFNDKKNRIEPLYGDTAFKVVQSVAAAYTKTTFGTSMHPGTIAQFIHDKSKNIENAMAKLFTDRFVHFGMLNVDNIEDFYQLKDGPLLYLSIVQNFQTTPGYHCALGVGLNKGSLGAQILEKARLATQLFPGITIIVIKVHTERAANSSLLHTLSPNPDLVTLGQYETLSMLRKERGLQRSVCYKKTLLGTRVHWKHALLGGDVQAFMKRLTDNDRVHALFSFAMYARMYRMPQSWSDTGAREVARNGIVLEYRMVCKYSNIARDTLDIGSSYVANLTTKFLAIFDTTQNVKAKCTPQHSDIDDKCLGDVNCWACSFLCFVAGCALVAGLLAYYLFAGALRESSRPQYLGSLGCHNCFTSGGLLTETLNASADPCQDFKAYVTSRWLPDPHGDASEYWKYKWDVKYIWVRLAAKEIRGPHFASPPESIVASSFRACESRSAENARETRAMFKMLLQILSIPWPELPTGNADPFDVHFTLCVRWNIPLWFDVRLLPERALKSRRAVYIGPSVYAKFWGSQYRSMGSEATIRQYVDQYLLYFDEDYGQNASLTIDSYLTFNFTRHVTFMLEAVHKNAGPEFHTFESLANAFGQRPDHFLNLMNKYFGPQKPFEPGDAAIVKKKGTTEVVSYITANHDSALLRSHMGWWVLQIYAPIADASFFVQKYGSKELAELLRPLFCETQMESSFKILLFSKLIALNFPQKVRQQVDEIFHNVRQETAALFEKSGSLAGANVGHKLRGMSINLWPKPEYRSRKKLQRIYASHNTSKATSLDHWIIERQANAKLIGSDAYFEDKRLPHSFSKEPIYYDSLLNEATVSMLLAHEPFFYPDGDAAVNYGGLGAAFSAALLAGGLETETADPAATLEEATANESLTTTRKAASLFRPNNTLTKGEAPGFLPAFHAFQALKDHPANDRAFSPEMLFFINYCHSQSRVRISFDCNAALRRTTSFVSAFHCEKGSRMNP
ncbi:hypothetical protein HPB49_009189 [Dermacentor silvarum]|uniref:Uncharacterized protein n=1 Tax=Dermacentor silvarum TaxID=543639 RepID=A0ACB8CE87_DERSI|nr:hypothetical protein HPB49_009189 [Dermacentor silvarum]